MEAIPPSAAALSPSAVDANSGLFDEVLDLMRALTFGHGETVNEYNPAGKIRRLQLHDVGDALAARLKAQNLFFAFSEDLVSSPTITNEDSHRDKLEIFNATWPDMCKILDLPLPRLGPKPVAVTQKDVNKPSGLDSVNPDGLQDNPSSNTPTGDSEEGCSGILLPWDEALELTPAPEVKRAAERKHAVDVELAPPPEPVVKPKFAPAPKSVAEPKLLPALKAVPKPKHRPKSKAPDASKRHKVAVNSAGSVYDPSSDTLVDGEGEEDSPSPSKRPKTKKAKKAQNKAAAAAAKKDAVPKTKAVSQEPIAKGKGKRPVPVSSSLCAPPQNAVPERAQKSTRTPALVLPTSNHCALRKATTPQIPAQKTAAPKRSVPVSSKLPQGEERHLLLFQHLIDCFPQDRRWLLAPAHTADHFASPSGIHVFVDSSNIFIGFLDWLRRNELNVANRRIAFDALSLILERRRPSSKRVLTGSLPNKMHLSAFDTSRLIGYQTHLLKRVIEVEDLSRTGWTTRQLKNFWTGRLQSGARIHPLVYDNLPKGAAKPALGYTSTLKTRYDQWTESLPDSIHPQSSVPAPAEGPLLEPANQTPIHPEQCRLVEQSVDETLHHAMALSIIDTHNPTTMVLATGDAAEARFSDGFYNHVLRALTWGWKVELYAWSHSIGKNWIELEKSGKWVDRFTIAYLDEFAPYLVDS